MMHHCVRLRWGFLNDTLPVDWAVPGDPSLYEALREYAATHRPVQIVWGAAPGWSDPWSRARRANIVSSDAGMLTVESDGQQWQIPRYEIQAVRPAPETRD